MLNPEQEKQIVEKVLAGLRYSQERRKDTNLENLVPYWRRMSEASDSQWFDMDMVRKHGTIKVIDDDDPQFNVSINYINQELLNMVASDLLAPLEYRILFKFFNPDNPVEMVIPGMTGGPTADAHTDMVKGVINSYLGPDKLALDDARLRLYNARYQDGTAYLTLDWDGDGGDLRFLPKKRVEGVEGPEKWEIVAGQWDKDGQFFNLPDQAGQVPVEEFRKQEMYKEEILAEGEPRLNVLNVFQVYWDLVPGEAGRNTIRGVYLVDHITKTQAKRDYSSLYHYGSSEPIEWEKLQDGGWLADIVNMVKGIFNRKASDDAVLRVRYRRRRDALAGEKRSVWMTIVGNRLVKISECPYGNSFDVSLGVYPYFARPLRSGIEGQPDIAFMMGSQKVCNAIDGLILEQMNSLPYGAYQSVGNQSPETNITTGAGPRVITANQPMVPIQLPQLDQTPFQQKSDMRYMIQYFGRSNQLSIGSRSQDANTAYQASVQQAYGQKMTSFNQFNDAMSWSMFFNDLKTLLGDPRLIKEIRKVRQVQTQGNRQFAMELQFQSTLFDYVDSLMVLPDDLRGKSEPEEKADIMALLSICNPMDPAEREFIIKLKKRLVELTNLRGIEYKANEVMMPGTPMPTEPAMPGRPEPSAPVNTTLAEKETLKNI